MRVRTGLIFGLLMLSGCIPQVAPPPSNLPDTPEQPYLEPDIAALETAPPAWEMRPVTASALTIDGKRYHQVATGETGIAIARAYGVPWSTIVTANQLTDPYILHVGQRLLLPDTTPATSIEARAAAFKLDLDDIETGSIPASATIAPQPVTPKFGGRFLWPLTGTIAERFGPVGGGRINRGVEIDTAPNAAIRASAPGTIVFVGNGGTAGYGGLILIRHADGWISAYGRAAAAVVTRGQAIKAGDVIGRVGSGASPRLHFEVRRDRVAIDPLKLLPPR